MLDVIVKKTIKVQLMTCKRLVYYGCIYVAISRAMNHRTGTFIGCEKDGRGKRWYSFLSNMTEGFGSESIRAQIKT